MLVIKQFGPVTYAMGTLQEILSGTGIAAKVRALPNDVAGCTLEMGADGLWTGNLGTLTQAQADALVASGALATVKVGTPGTVGVTLVRYGGAGVGWVAAIQPKRRRVWGLGDSHTAGISTGGGGITASGSFFGGDTTRGGINYRGGTWLPWAHLASNGAWTIAGAAAAGGYTAAQIITTHLPRILDAASIGDIVVVFAGTNGEVLADVITIHKTLIAAGLNTIAVTLPPNAASTVASVRSFNTQLETFCDENGIRVADVSRAVGDPATGAWASTYYGDGTHGNQVGCKVVGETIAAVVNAITSGPILLIEHNASMPGQQLFAKPLALGSPVSGTDYSNVGGVGDGSFAPASFTEARGGSGYKAVVGAGGTVINGIIGSATLVAGSMYRFGCIVKAALSGANPRWAVYLETTAGAVICGFGYTTNLVTTIDSSRFFFDFPVPVGLPVYSVRVHVVAIGIGTEVSVGEVTLVNLGPA